MAKTFATKYKGIRYREHPERLNGLRPDRYFTIRYKIGGKLKEEGWGWESENNSLDDAFAKRHEIMSAIKNGLPVATLAERRAKAEQIRAEKAIADASAKKANITFDEFFNSDFKESSEKEPFKHNCGMYNNWIKPIIGNKTFAEITALDMAKIKKKALKGRVVKNKGTATDYIRKSGISKLSL